VSELPLADALMELRYDLICVGGGKPAGIVVVRLVTELATNSYPRSTAALADLSGACWPNACPGTNIGNLDYLV